MSELLDSLWIEKFRPKTLEELVLPERYRSDFGKFIERKSIPNLLFSGPPGGGKTTLGKVLCSKHGVLQNRDDNLLFVNGSARRSRGIGFVDEVIEPFLKHPPIKDTYKILFIDEADKLTKDGYDSLRGVIEKYHVTYSRFLFTCNYISKIPDAVQSRFIPYTFTRLPKEFVLDFCEKILKTENIEYNEKDIKMVINNLYPDVRKIVNALQKTSLSGKLEVTEKDVITTEKKIIALIVQIVSLLEKGQDKKIGSAVSSIIEILAGHDLEYSNIYSELFFMKSIPASAKIIINKSSNEHQSCLVPHMHIMSMVFEIIKSLQAYRKAVSGK